MRSSSKYCFNFKLTLTVVALFIVVLNVIIVPNDAAIWGFGDDKRAEDSSTKPMKDEEVVNDDDLKFYTTESGAIAEAAITTIDYRLHHQTNINEEKVKIHIEDHFEHSSGDGDIPTDEIKTIHSLGEQHSSASGGQYVHGNRTIYSYDRSPQQSHFVDRTPHPTESHEMDPRFSRPRQCSEDQYLCRKVTPQQEHIRCIPNEWRCNGVRDCEENDDEEGCAVNVHRPAPNGCKSPQQYTCHNTGINGYPAQCVEVQKLCDGNYDCPHGDDEIRDRCDQFLKQHQEYQQQQEPQYPHQSQPSHQQPVYTFTTNPTSSRGSNGNSQLVQSAPQSPPNYITSSPSIYSPQYPPSYQQQPQPQQSQQCYGKTEEYIKRLEWVDRCFRSCLKG